MIEFQRGFSRIFKGGAGLAAGLFFLASAALAQDIALQVEFLSGGNSLDFGRIKNLRSDGSATSEVSTRQVRLTITPDPGNERPYVITQVLEPFPSNEAGNRAPENSVLYRVEEQTGSGIVRIPSQTPLQWGEQEIYRSSPSGGSAVLLVTYDLTSSTEQEAGIYHGNLVYRVSTF